MEAVLHSAAGEVLHQPGGHRGGAWLDVEQHGAGLNFIQRDLKYKDVKDRHY